MELRSGQFKLPAFVDESHLAAIEGSAEPVSYYVVSPSPISYQVGRIENACRRGVGNHAAPYILGRLGPNVQQSMSWVDVTGRKGTHLPPLARSVATPSHRIV